MTSTDTDTNAAAGAGYNSDRLISGYFAVGRILGGLAGIATFIGGWIYCVAHYGFLIGVSLGWIPAGICAAVVGGLVMFLWGLAALGALAWAINASQPSQPAATYTPAADAAAVATDAAATAADAAADAASVTAAQAPPWPAPASAPPAPGIGEANAAIGEFQRVYSGSGMAGAVAFTVDCYGKLGSRPSWSGWDFCAAFDQLGAQVSDQKQRRNSAPPTEYFNEYKVADRQLRAAQRMNWDPALNRDRISALKAMLAQAIEARASAVPQSSTEPAPDQPPQQAHSANDQPSFNCSGVRSVNLKLICATASLAAADQELAAAYRSALAKSSSPQTLRESQRAWISRRNNAEADVTTIAAMYTERTAQLRALTAP